MFCGTVCLQFWSFPVVKGTLMFWRFCYLLDVGRLCTFQLPWQIERFLPLNIFSNWPFFSQHFHQIKKISYTFVKIIITFSTIFQKESWKDVERKFGRTGKRKKCQCFLTQGGRTLCFNGDHHRPLISLDTSYIECCPQKISTSPENSYWSDKRL